MSNEMYVMGVEKLDYISKKTNERVNGCIVYVGQYIDNGTKAVANVFVRNAEVSDFPIGYECRVYYNRFGKPCVVEVI